MASRGRCGRGVFGHVAPSSIRVASSIRCRPLRATYRHLPMLGEEAPGRFRFAASESAGGSRFCALCLADARGRAQPLDSGTPLRRWAETGASGIKLALGGKHGASDNTAAPPETGTAPPCRLYRGSALRALL